MLDYLSQLRPERFPSPCFVTDLDKLAANAAILDGVQQRTGAKILLALKAFAQWKTFGLLSRQATGPLYGCCASSPDEARLAREEFGGEVHSFAAAWSEAELAEALRYSDHLVYNSFNQWRKFQPLVRQYSAQSGRRIECGLRLNPEHSEGATALYNPCAPGSRLGIRQAAFLLETEHEPQLLDQVDGLHFHTLCEQNADALANTLTALEAKFGPWLYGRKWINFGGGHHITRPDYDLALLDQCIVRMRDKYQAQIYLEPGEAVALNAGVLIAEVLDVVQADLPIALLDISAACHMPDVLEMPYRPGIIGSGLPGAKAWTCRIGGKSCLAGDVVGEYSFDAPLQVGQRLVFTDMAIYSMVKTTTFNGIRLPDIARWQPSTDEIWLDRSFAYEDFRNRLS